METIKLYDMKSLVIIALFVVLAYIADDIFISELHSEMLYLLNKIYWIVPNFNYFKCMHH